MSEILFKGTVTSSPCESEDHSFDFIIRNDLNDFAITNLPRTKDSLKLLLSGLEERSKDNRFSQSKDYPDFRKFLYGFFLNNLVLIE